MLSIEADENRVGWKSLFHVNMVISLVTKAEKIVICFEKMVA